MVALLDVIRVGIVRHVFGVWMPVQWRELDFSVRRGQWGIIGIIGRHTGGLLLSVAFSGAGFG